jgi:hypothetical protein
MVTLQKRAEEIAYGAKDVSNILVTIRRITDDVPIQVISKNPDWTMIAEDLNDRYPTSPIEQRVNDLSYHDAIML